MGAGRGVGGSLSVAFLACNLPRTFSRAGGCAGRARKPRFLCAFFLPSHFPRHNGLTCLFPSTRVCSFVM